MSNGDDPPKLSDLLPCQRLRAASQFRNTSDAIFEKLKRDGFVVLEVPTPDKPKLSSAHQSLMSYRCKANANFEGKFLSARHLPRRHVLEVNPGGSGLVMDQELPPAEDDWTDARQMVADEAMDVLQVATSYVLDAIAHSLRLGIDAVRDHVLEGNAPCTDAAIPRSALQVVSYENAATVAEARDIARQEQHEDTGLLTAVYCPIPGLQVQVPKQLGQPDRPEEWTSVPWGHDTMVVMVGYTLEHATAGMLRSCVHRVQPSTSGPCRTSLTFKLRARSTAILPRGLMLAGRRATPSQDDEANTVSALMQTFQQTHGPSLNGAPRVPVPQEEQRQVKRRRLAEVEDRSTIFIEMLGGGQITLKCDTVRCTGLSLKRSLCHKLQTSMDRVRLLFDNRHLIDNKTLAESGVEHEDTIYFCVAMCGD